MQLALILGRHALADLCHLSRAIAPREEVSSLRSALSGVVSPFASSTTQKASSAVVDADVNVLMDGSGGVDFTALSASQQTAVTRVYEATQRELNSRGMNMIHRYRRMSNADLAEVRRQSIRKLLHKRELQKRDSKSRVLAGDDVAESAGVTSLSVVHDCILVTLV